MKLVKCMLAAAAVMALSSSCVIRFDLNKIRTALDSASMLKASGVCVTRDTAVADFSGIVASGSIDVRFVQKQGENKVSICASDNVLPYVRLTEEDGNLNIRTEFPSGLSLISCGDIVVTVTSPDLASVELFGSCDFKCGSLEMSDGNFRIQCCGSSDAEFGTLTAASLDIQAAGSSDVEFGRIATGNLDVSAAGSCDVELKNITAATLRTNMSGSSDICVSGRADEAEYRAAGSSDVDASALECKSTVTSVAGNCSVKYREADGRLIRL